MHLITRMTGIRIALLALAVGVLAAPAAQAATVSSEGGGLVVSAGPERNDIGLQQPGEEDGRIVVYDGSGTPMTSATPACEERGENAVVCSWDPAAGVRVDLGGGNDWGYVSSGLQANGVFSIGGGEGDDKLQSSNDGQTTTLDGGLGNDQLEGGPGTDVLTGGEGDDALKGLAGRDSLSGGGGNDNLSGDGNKGTFADAIDGGAGYDTIDADWQDESGQEKTLNLTLGGGADDGRPGEGDDVRNVESVETYLGSTLVGTDAAEKLVVFQILAPATLVGNGGDDELRGSGGPDKLEGGAGNDYLDAGFGDDTIVGGPGRDAIYGDLRGGDCGPLWCTLPYGNDTIEARDGEVDSITCGTGQDQVNADPSDVVAGDCEVVNRAAAKTGGSQCVVPKLRGLKLKAAKSKLAKAHCRAKVRYKRGHGKPGTVVATSAKPKKHLAAGALVTITISKGR